MKKFSFLVAGAFCLFSVAQAQEVVITQSDDLTVSNNGVSCGEQPVHTSFNEFSRSFVLADFGVTNDFQVNKVGFGLSSLGGDLDFTVRISTTDDSYPFGNLTELGSQVIPFDIMMSDTFVETELTTPIVVPAGSEMVFSYEGDGEFEGVMFFPGSNNLGESGPSYIMAPGCGLNEPATFASIGFPDVNLVMTVTGEDAVMGTVELNSNSVSVYPNPATDVVNIKMNNGETAQSISVANLTGQNVMTSKAANSINVSFLPAGVYVVKVVDSKGVTHMTKVVKK